MKLVSLNAWQGRLLRNIPEFFRKQQADIICLQEVYDAKDAIPTLEFFQSILTIKNASALEHSYFSAVHSYEVMGAKVSFGNCILSRFPITKQSTIFTRGEYNIFTNPSTFVGNNRNAQIVEILVNDNSIHVVNHHAYWEKDPMGSSKSLEIIKKLCDALRPIKGPLLIAGDFNLNSNSKPLAFLKDSLQLRDLTEELGIKSTLSSQVTTYVADCDHLFINEYIQKETYTVEDKLLSDHKALTLKFNVKSGS